MQHAMQDLSILGIFAHPDDEQLMSGVFAQAASEGIRTGLICATRGEEGEIADPSLATPETLGHVREGELRAAAIVLGIKHLWFLDYRDSGMKGTPPNENPGCLYRCDEDEALAKIVKTVRDFKPTVIVTFERTGGYGHPDHLTIHKLATLAFDAAADPNRFPEAGEPWQTSRLYYSGFPRSVMRSFARFASKMEIETGFRDVNPAELGMDDSEITNSIDVSRWVPLKEQSLQFHRTQMNPNSPFVKAPKEIMYKLRATEHYALAAGTPLPNSPDARADLFAGLRS